MYNLKKWKRAKTDVNKKEAKLFTRSIFKWNKKQRVIVVHDIVCVHFTHD